MAEKRNTGGAGDAGLFPPHDLAAERAVLASMMLSGNAASTAAKSLNPSDFYQSGHRRVFQSFCRLIASGQPIDAVLVADDMEKHKTFDDAGGWDMLLSLMDAPATPSTIDRYMNIVRDYAARRRVLDISTRAAGQVYNPAMKVNDLIAEIDKASVEIAAERGGEMQITPAEMNALIASYFDESTPAGIPTGVSKDFDRLSGGLHFNEMTVVAGRPSTGKTTFALNVIRQACIKEGRRVMFFSLEMSRLSVLTNLLSSLSGLNARMMRSGMLSSDEKRSALVDAAAKVYEAPLLIDDEGGLTISDIRLRSMQEHRRAALDIIIIDYLQFMRGDPSIREREQQVADISRGLKNLAKILHIPVLVLAQLNRNPEGRKDGKPLLSDLRESGAIEQDADMVVLLHAKEDSPKTLRLIVAKNRNGPTGAVTIFYDRSTMRMGDYLEKETETWNPSY